MGQCFSRSRRGKFVINENNNCYIVDMPHKKHATNGDIGMKKLDLKCDLWRDQFGAHVLI